MSQGPVPCICSAPYGPVHYNPSQAHIVTTPAVLLQIQQQLSPRRAWVRLPRCGGFLLVVQCVVPSLRWPIERFTSAYVQCTSACISMHQLTSVCTVPGCWPVSSSHPCLVCPDPMVADRAVPLPLWSGTDFQHFTTLSFNESFSIVNV